MMYSTWDILSTNNLSYDGDKTEQWESQIEKRTGKKIKFPIKIKDESLERVDLEISDPDVIPVTKKKSLDKSVKVVRKENKKDKNKKLF